VCPGAPQRPRPIFRLIPACGACTAGVLIRDHPPIETSGVQSCAMLSLRSLLGPISAMTPCSAASCRAKPSDC
jgi:hypothetical protein